MHDTSRQKSPLMKTAAAYVAGGLLVFTALYSGGINPFSRHVFFVVVMAALVVSAGRAAAPAAKAWPAWLVVGVSFLSLAWTVGVNSTLDAAFELAGYVVFAGLVAYSAEGRTRGRLVAAVFAACCLVSAYAFYQYFVGFAHTREYISQTGGMGLGAEAIGRAMMTLEYRRAFSTMFSPNVLACYIAMAVPLGLVMFESSRSRAGKAAFGTGVALVAASLVLTKSVGGFIAFLASILIYALFRLAAGTGRGGMKKPGAKTAIAVFAAAVVVTGAFYGVLSMRTGGFFGFERSVSGRIGFFAGAVDVFRDAPLTGRGAGSFAVTYPAHMDEGAGQTRYVHNLLLQTLAETGITGLAALAALFVAFFAMLYKKARKGDMVSAAAAAGGAAFLVHNLLDFSYYIPETAVLFWFYYGLAASAPGIGDKGAEEGAGTRGMGRPALSVLQRSTAVLLAIIICFFYINGLAAQHRHDQAVELMRQAGFESLADVRSKPVPEEALALAEESVSLKPYDDGFHAFLGAVYEGVAIEKGPDAAEMAARQYSEAIRLNPQYPYHYRDMGYLYLRMRDKSSAAKFFGKALDRHPTDKNLKKILESAEK